MKARLRTKAQKRAARIKKLRKLLGRTYNVGHYRGARRERVRFTKWFCENVQYKGAEAGILYLKRSVDAVRALEAEL